MINFLISHFIKDYKDIDNTKVRERYGLLAGIVGITINVLLSIVKLVIGSITNSIAVVVDGVNNLSDAASSLITIISFKLSNKPADKEHPFGHGRIEYLAALIVSFLVMLVGFEFIKSSFERIMSASKIYFKVIPFILILLSILAKLWLGYFNKKLGNLINSSTLKASSVDAFSDAKSSSIVALSFVISIFTTFPIDGYLGIVISILIILSAVQLIKDTINPLLGEAPNPELVRKIKGEILKYDYITGVHDLIIHNYGPSKFMVTLHAEVPCDISIMKIHEIIDTAEKELSKKFNILLVIHMDPINTDDAEVSKAKSDVEKVLKKYPIIKSFHDFRMVGKVNYINLVFDIVVDFESKLNDTKLEELLYNIEKDLKNINPSYNAVITIDKDYC